MLQQSQVPPRHRRRRLLLLVAAALTPAAVGFPAAVEVAAAVAGLMGISQLAHPEHRVAAARKAVRGSQ